MPKYLFFSNCSYLVISCCGQLLAKANNILSDKENTAHKDITKFIHRKGHIWNKTVFQFGQPHFLKPFFTNYFKNKNRNCFCPGLLNFSGRWTIIITIFQRLYFRNVISDIGHTTWRLLKSFFCLSILTCRCQQQFPCHP